MVNKEKKQKVLITGSSGFLGSHIMDALDKSGYEVVLFDKSTSQYKQKGHKEVLGDILDVDDVNKAIKGCDFVYHFAAQADIDFSSNVDM